MSAPWANSKFLIPALNEEESLPKVLDSLFDIGILPGQILILDNGSKDSTPQIAIDAGVILIQEPTRGYGAACLAGIRYLQERKISPEFIVFMDADGSDDLGNLNDLFFAFSQDPNTNFVIGSRTLGNAEPGSLSFLQKFGNRLSCFLIRTFYGVVFTDLGPFRILRWQSLLQLNLQDLTWGWNLEMQIKAVRNGFKIKEVPVHYRKRNGGKSKISGNLVGSLKAGVKILYIFFKLTFST
ncbi:glycosyltransferase family 2 protein [Leptospira licerasiae]|uniref:Glycosyltransferase, group 2 family protein n=1 Tax=Leptospira licerasiae str. MMD4847 TaxID=1049971 RepID=A0ABN0H3Q2_9LEPT|nr:glycosyltransferase family 2 protein [Leptospira licerasiae]EIE02916.1 glycosyltransferase, group 2 family protein [Leptospira licerasiae serovar Varillal str. VAR 010]EJZ40316.1 glycosyltransferase, group 2 family protein [Leptospira licerasiae str. MMD4847]